VLIARSSAVERPWPRLLDDVKSALIRLAADLGAPTAAAASAQKPIVEASTQTSTARKSTA
jgi:ribonuclease P protein component